jgi:hypothetical protein
MMETGPGRERRRRVENEEEDEARPGGRRRDTIVIRLPEFDANLRDLLFEMIPGRGLLRILSDLPEEVVTHTRNARRERLLAMRSFIDALIEDSERAPRNRQRAQEIEVE